VSVTVIAVLLPLAATEVMVGALVKEAQKNQRSA
jgi:hypothetical protein